MSDRPGYRRLNLEVPEELYIKLIRAVPWGNRNTVFEALIKCLVKSLAQAGAPLLGALMYGEVTIVYDPPSRENVTPPSRNP